MVTVHWSLVTNIVSMVEINSFVSEVLGLCPALDIITACFLFDFFWFSVILKASMYLGLNQLS